MGRGVHRKELIKYLEKITNHKFTPDEVLTILEIIYFGDSSKKKDGKYYMTPGG